MKLITATISGAFVAVVCYMLVWFFARNRVDGLGTAIEVGGHVLVALLALAVGFGAFPRSLARG